MFKKNVKIKQLDIQSQKLNSNNDSVLIDTSIQLHINDTTLSIACVPTHIDHLITGYIYYHFNHASLVEISQQNSDYYCQLSHSDQSIINTKAIQSSSTHFIDIINANRQFKSNQSMYHDTGATMSVGAIVNNDEMILFEDISFENALYKLIGHWYRRRYYLMGYCWHRMRLQPVLHCFLISVCSLISSHVSATM